MVSVDGPETGQRQVRARFAPVHHDHNSQMGAVVSYLFDLMTGKDKDPEMERHRETWPR